MTSKKMRTNPLFMRNEFEVEGRWDFPIIHRQEIDLNDIELISCADVSRNDNANLHKGVHFFCR